MSQLSFPVTAKFSRIPTGPAGTRNTLERMRELVSRAVTDPVVIEAAQRIVRNAGVRPFDYLGEVRAVFEFARDRVRYTRDPQGVELLKAPRVTLAHMAGDCDDKSTLLAALVRALGNPTRVAFRAIGTNPLAPGAYSHVYVVARVQGQDVAMDPTPTGAQLGWEYPLRVGRPMEVAA